MPDTHPANPNSAEAQAVRKRGEDEMLAMKKKQEQKQSAQKGASGGENRNWFQKKKDALIGTKEERRAAKAEKQRVRAEQEKKLRVSFICSSFLSLLDTVS